MMNWPRCPPLQSMPPPLMPPRPGLFAPGPRPPPFGPPRPPMVNLFRCLRCSLDLLTLGTKNHSDYMLCCNYVDFHHSLRHVFISLSTDLLLPTVAERGRVIGGDYLDRQHSDLS